MPVNAHDRVNLTRWVISDKMNQESRLVSLELIFTGGVINLKVFYRPDHTHEYRDLFSKHSDINLELIRLQNDLIRCLPG